jgi:hypothetical protein
MSALCQLEPLDTAHGLPSKMASIWDLDRMPWTANEAERHTHKAITPALKELWAKVANESLERTGDEGRAIREANAVVARQAGTSK